MRSVKLKLEQLQVDSFATDVAGATTKGTVRGYQDGYTVGEKCATVDPGAWGCENSGVASCVLCPAESQSCQDCSWTVGNGAMCHW
jgi:hypothetical protein